MPIYAYKCSACGHADDVLQKISADALTVCPACGQSTYSKQVTAPQFQLKGSGWYVTDFRGGNGAAKEASKDSATKSDTKPAADAKTETKTAGTPAACPVHTPATPAPAAAPAAKPATTE